MSWIAQPGLPQFPTDLGEDLVIFGAEDVVAGVADNVLVLCSCSPFWFLDLEATVAVDGVTWKLLTHVAAENADTYILRYFVAQVDYIHHLNNTFHGVPEHARFETLRKLKLRHGSGQQMMNSKTILAGLCGILDLLVHAVMFCTRFQTHLAIPRYYAPSIASGMLTCGDHLSFQW